MSNNIEALNYGPTAPDKVRLPAGKTCGNCLHINHLR